MKVYRTGTGREIRLRDLIGKGGEGAVFDVDGENDLAAKIYTDGKHLERREKIMTMVSAQFYKRSSFVAFPIDILLNERGEFVGFTMRKVRGVKPIHDLYAPASRKVEFPKANFRFLARTATNVARAIASVHQTGCVIGDINHSGFLVSERATVTLIDADSFQIRAGTKVYRCRVGVGEYTPPELQGIALDTVDREPAHDTFGLAVMVFQLLFMGRHPFAGRYGGLGDMPIEKAIKEGRFAYSVQRRAETKMAPPPFAPTLSDVTPELALAFERSFVSNPAQFRNRPTAADWVNVLSRFETELIPCGINPAHHRPKNTRECPWCRLENGMDITLFYLPGSATPPVVHTNFDLNAAIAAIERILGPGEPPDPSTLMPPIKGLSKSPLAKQAKQELTERRVGGVLLAAACFALTANVESTTSLRVVYRVQ